MIIPAVVLDLQASETTLADLGGRGFTDALGEGGKPENQAGRGGTQAESGVQTRGAVPGGLPSRPRPHALLSATPARCLLLKHSPEAGGKQGWLSGARGGFSLGPRNPILPTNACGKARVPTGLPMAPWGKRSIQPLPQRGAWMWKRLIEAAHSIHNRSPPHSLPPAQRARPRLPPSPLLEHARLGEGLARAAFTRQEIFLSVYW